MDENRYRGLFLKTKAYYFSLGKIRCPVFNNEEIHFSRHGFEHLIRKGGKLRSAQEQTRRLFLVRHVVACVKYGTLKESRVVKKYINGEEVSMYFWSIIHKQPKRTIVVVIIQHNNKPKQFLSVVNRN